MPASVMQEVKHRFPCLETVLSRATTAPGKTDYHATLFGFFDGVSKDYPIGALKYLAETGEYADQYLMQADPVHLKADQDCVLLFDFSYLELSETDANTYLKTFNQHFAEDGLRLLKTASKRWYLKVAHKPDIQTSSLEQVIGHNIDKFLPIGPDAAKWRHFINEIQMVFFSLAEDLPMVSGIWPHGGGVLTSLSAPDIDVVSGDNLLIEGLAKHTGLTFDPEQVRQPHGLMVIESVQKARANVDLDAWLTAVTELEALICELKTADLTLYPCNGKSYHWRANNNWHFWRRNKLINSF